LRVFVKKILFHTYKVQIRYTILKQLLPDGTFNEDQISILTLVAFKGGQFITGKLVYPAITGPKPLLRPATATMTTGIRKPKIQKY